MVAAVMIVLVVMVAALFEVGRSGYTVVKGEEGTVELLQGEGFLWFEPTVEVETDLVVAGLPDLDRERVEAGQEFETRSEADTYLAYLQTLVDDGS